MSIRHDPPAPASVDAARERTAARVAHGAVWLVLIVALAWLGVTGRDISPARWLAADVIVRDAGHPQPLYRFRDPSPYAVWLPSDHFVRDSVRRGELPLWERTHGGGYSTLGRFDLGVLHPLRLALAAVPETLAPSAALLVPLAILFSLTLAWLRALGVRAGPAAIGALVVSATPYALYSTHFGGPQVFLFVPWLLLAESLLRRAPSPWTFAHVVLVAALSFTAGHPVYLFVALTTASFVALVHAAVEGELRTSLPRSLAAVGLGLLIAAPVWLPFVAAWPDGWNYKTETAEGHLNHAMGFAAWLQRLAGLASGPDAFFVDEPGFYARMGLPAVLLSLAGAVVAWRHRAVRPLAFLLAVAAIIAVPGPWMAPVLELPPLRWVNPPYAMASLVFGIGATAAVGAGAALDRVPARWRALVGVVLAIAVVAPGAPACVAVLTPTPQVSSWHADGLDALRDASQEHRVTGLWGHTLLPNTGYEFGVEDLRTMSAIHSRRYHAWFELVSPGVVGFSFPTVRVTSHVFSPLLRQFSVSHVVAAQVPFDTFHTAQAPRDMWANNDPASIPVRGVGEPIYRDTFVAVLPLAGEVLPRVWSPSHVRVVEPGIDVAASALQTRPIGPREVVVELPAGDPARAAIEQSGGAQIDATWSWPTSRSMSIDVTTSAPTLLVVAESWDAGWAARVDGAPSPVHPVNVLMRGVWLPEAGVHRIELRFAPRGWRAGLGLAALGLVLLAAVATVWWRRGRKALGMATG